jgi:hypothetical protein
MLGLEDVRWFEVAGCRLKGGEAREIDPFIIEEKDRKS